MAIFNFRLCDTYGNILEQDAVLAETSNSYQGAFWGRTAADISTEFIDVGQGWERVPDRYALFHINRMEF